MAIGCLAALSITNWTAKASEPSRDTAVISERIATIQRENLQGWMMTSRFLPAGHFYKVNVDDKYLPPPHSTARVGSEVKILTDALSKINSSQDTVVRLNESGSVIVLNKQFCPAPSSSDTSLTNP
jgi:hypothetical protein